MLDLWLGVEGYAETGSGEHRQVVGSVAYGDCLFDVDIFDLGDDAQQLGFALAVDNITDIATC